MKLGRLLQAASAALVAIVAIVLFLSLPALAQGNSDDIPDIRLSVDISEIREGRRATLTVSHVDGQPDAVNRHVFLAISGTATVGSEPDFTITGSNGSPLPSIGETIYNREIVIPAGATSAYARINVRNDNDAEQCEVIKVEGLWRDPGRSAKAFLGILELRIPANDLNRPGAETLPSVSLEQVDKQWTATLIDPAASDQQTWAWDRSTRADGPWTEVAYDSASYTPEEGDGVYYIRAEVRYDISLGTAACAHVVWQEQGDGNRGNTNPGNTNPGNTNPGNTNPGNTNPGNTNPGNTKGGNTNGDNGNGDNGNGGEGNQDEGETKSTDDTDGFSDLDSAGEHTRAVRILYGEGVFEDTGCSEGLLCPGGPLLRWEAAVWFVRVLDGMDPDPVSSVRFTDVDPKVWWASYIERLAELKVTIGCREDPDHYCPDVEVTRAEMATLLKRAFDPPAAEPVGFVDTARTVHAPNIDLSYAAGIIDSCSADPLKFCPWDSNSRAEVAGYLLRGRNFAASADES